MKRFLYEKRFYRKFSGGKGRVSFEVHAGESDLFILLPERFAGRIPSLKKILTEHLIAVRSQIQMFIKENPVFLKSIEPVDFDGVMLPSVINSMVVASKAVGVGPMAGVAGAVNKIIAEKLMEEGIDEFIIENGGDVYINSFSETVVGLFTGTKIDSEIGIMLPPGKVSVCSSSSRIGPSLSFGRTTIATVIGDDPVLADCAATFIGNSISIEDFIRKYDSVPSIRGAFVMLNGKICIKGDVNFVKLKGGVLK